MAISLARGQRVKLRAVDVFADGVAIKEPGAECFRLCRDLIDGILLVDNAAISGATRLSPNSYTLKDTPSAHDPNHCFESGIVRI